MGRVGVSRNGWCWEQDGIGQWTGVSNSVFSSGFLLLFDTLPFSSYVRLITESDFELSHRFFASQHVKGDGDALYHERYMP